MKFYDPKLLKLAEMFHTIPDLKGIELSVAVIEVGFGFDDVVIVGIDKVNGVSQDWIGSFCRVPEDFSLKETQDTYCSFLVEAGLKSEEFSKIARTLKSVGSNFLSQFSFINRKDFMGVEF